MPWLSETAAAIPRSRVEALLDQTVAEARRRICATPRRVLLLPPDITRMHSGAGWITESFYNLLSPTADVHVIPTLGQHEPHTREQNAQMFGKIPHERIHPHDWRGGCVKVGQVPAEFVAGTGGKSLYPFGAAHANSVVRYATFGYLRVTLGDGVYSWQFRTETGVVTDSGTGTCH